MREARPLEQWNEWAALVVRRLGRVEEVAVHLNGYDQTDQRRRDVLGEVKPDSSVSGTRPYKCRHLESVKMTITCSQRGFHVLVLISVHGCDVCLV